MGHVSVWGSVENVSPYMTDLNWFLILFSLCCSKQAHGDVFGLRSSYQFSSDGKVGDGDREVRDKK